MIILESKLVRKEINNSTTDYEYASGYFLTIDDLEKLVRDFQVDNHDGFVSNDQAYIEEWLKNHKQIVK
jgi:hypothetical protein